MKTLKQIQEENRKFIIMANNPTAKTYEEALEMELGFGCLLGDVYYRGDRLSCLDCVVILKYGKDNFLDTFISYGESLDMFIGPAEWDDKEIFQYKIIGKALTLSRVLIAFGRESLDLWKDLEEETLENQSEEVQRKFNELISEI